MKKPHFKKNFTKNAARRSTKKYALPFIAIVLLACSSPAAADYSGGYPLTSYDHNDTVTDGRNDSSNTGCSPARTFAGDATENLRSDNNVVGFQDRGGDDEHAFFMVEYGEVTPAPFLVYGWISDCNGTPVLNPDVTITNQNTGGFFTAETNANSHYYQLMLTQGIDLTTDAVLQFDVKSPDGSQSTSTSCSITPQEITRGGLFNVTISPGVHDISIKSNYTGACDTGIRIDNATTEAIGLDQHLTIGNTYSIKYKVVNNGTVAKETVNITVKMSNATGWGDELANYTKDIKKHHLGNVTWDTFGLVPGKYNITVNASIPDDAYPKDNERTRQVTMTVSPQTPPLITAWYNNRTMDNSLEITVNVSEGIYFNATANQTIDRWRWFKDGVAQEHKDDKFTTSWDVAGLRNVSVYGENENGTSNTISWNVTVRDFTPPTVIDKSPTGTNVAIDATITAAFSKAMNPSTLNMATVRVENSTGGMVTGAVTYGSATKTVTFDPTGDFEYHETYTVTITTGVQDLAGTNMTSNFTWNFTTSKPPSTTVSIAHVLAPSGGIITAPIMVNHVTNLGSGTINLTYKPSVVHVTNVTGGSGNALVVQAWSADNTLGTVQIVTWNATDAHSGDVLFAHVTYKAVASAGSTPLNITVRDLVDYYNYTQIPHDVRNGTFSIMDTGPPVVTSPSANPDTIPNNGTVYSQLNVTVTDEDCVANVTINLTSIGGSPVQLMNNLPGAAIWTVTTNATEGYGLQNLIVNATDSSGNSNTSVRIQLTITDAARPLLSNASANPSIILNDNGRPRPPGTNVSRLNSTVIDTGGSGIATVTINLSGIGGSPMEPMTHISDTNNWTVSTTAQSGINLTSELLVTATDGAGNSNSTGISLTVLRRGDVVRDDEVDVGDAFHIAMYLVGKVSLSELDSFVADVTPAAEHNGITSGDALYIAKNVVGKEPEP